MVGEKARDMSRAFIIDNALRIGSAGERNFENLFDCVGRCSSNRDKKHCDFVTDNGIYIDVKGLKRCHEHNFVLVEFKNVIGKDGWCSKSSKADLIAFEFPEGFYVVNKEDLRELTLSLCGEINNVNREAKIKSSNNKWMYDYSSVENTWLGRFNRGDVYTFISKDNLLSLNNYFKRK